MAEIMEIHGVGGLKRIDAETSHNCRVHDHRDGVKLVFSSSGYAALLEPAEARFLAQALTDAAQRFEAREAQQ